MDKDFWKRRINFSGFKSLYLFQKGQNNGAKISAFDAIRVFPDKFIPEIDFTEKAVVPCDVPVVKILL